MAQPRRGRCRDRSARDHGGRSAGITVLTASWAMARSAEPKASGADSLKDEGSAVPTRFASPWQAVVGNGDGEGRGRGTHRRGSGRSPGRPSRWRSRGETIAVPRCPHGRGVRGRERDAMTGHALTVGGRHQRCGQREPCAGAERRAEGERSRCPQGRGKRTWRRREAPRCATRARGADWGGDPHCGTDWLVAAGSAPPLRVGAVKGDAESGDWNADGRDCGRSPVRSGRRRSRGKADAAAGAGARWPLRARAAQARMRRAAMRGGGTAKRGEPIAAEAATGS